LKTATKAADNSMKNTEHTIKEYVTDVKDNVENVVEDIVEKVEHTAEVLKEKTVDLIKKVEPHHKVDTIVQHGEGTN
jgi:hypothetical protein